MGAPLSEDLRVRVIEAVEKGSSRRQAANRFGVSVASAVAGFGKYRFSIIGPAFVEKWRLDLSSHRIVQITTKSVQ